MAYPQGINFRATLGAGIDGANEHGETAGNPLLILTYPTTTAQGNTVGYESGVMSPVNIRDRNVLLDVRLLGTHWISDTGYWEYRLDLASAGAKNIRCALGDASHGFEGIKLEVFDTSSSLGTLVDAASSGAAMWFDATGVQYNATDWPGSNTAVAKTFSTTICRFRLSRMTGGSANFSYSHLYVEDAGGGGGGYTLTIDQGTYSLSGQSVGVRATRIIGLSQGSYALNGQTVALRRAFPLIATQGSYALNGQVVALRADRKLTATQGSYSMTGQSVALSKSVIFSAASGLYDLTGYAAGLVVSRLMAIAQGAYALSGQAVTLTTGAILSAVSGSYALTGQAVSLIRSRLLQIASGTYNLAGQAVGLVRSYPNLAIGSGSYTITGQAVGFIRAAVLSCVQGSYNLVGRAVTLTYSGAGALDTAIQKFYIQIDRIWRSISGWLSTT